MIKQKTQLLLLSLALTVSTAACGKSGGAHGASAVPKSEGHAPHWTYSGDAGPSHWGELDPANAACVNGSEQSPINIDRSAVKPNPVLEDIDIHYKPSAFTLMNNGHTIQANAAPSSDNWIRVEGTAYKLVQLHFHLPSEHLFDGKRLDMELHLVHKSDNGGIAVLGVILKSGKEQPALSPIWSKMPQEVTESDLVLDQPVNLNALLPADTAVFRYKGSLTTPPCTENVKWLVLEQPVEISEEQIGRFRQLLPNSARPVQELKGRSVEKGEVNLKR